MLAAVDDGDDEGAEHNRPRRRRAAASRAAQIRRRFEARLSGYRGMNLAQMESTSRAQSN